MKRVLLSLMISTILMSGIAQADDLKDVGPPPKTEMPSCEMTYDHLFQMDAMFYFMNNMRNQFELALKNKELKDNKAIKEYKKQKQMIDMAFYEWQRSMKHWIKRWDKECKNRTKV